MEQAPELAKAYDASQVEDRIYAMWEASGMFNPDNLPDRNQHGEPYCIMMPPPNRTGTLHMGHAMFMTIEDVMIRFHRLRGRRTVWIPGTDHAAIATSVKVEKILQEKEGKTRHDIGREAFLARVVAFAEESKTIIHKQIRKMGSSCDWSRDRYTLDTERNCAVNEVFKMMFDDGVIERGHRIVNWDPSLQTTISDDEIEWVEETVPFYTFKYGPFEISTARPETKFGDKYVVMHPNDERYAAYKHGDTFTCEWINGEVTATVIKDDVIDPAFGTGVMTITPWHAMTDFEIAERHGLDREQIIDYSGNLLPIAGEFTGMSIEAARPKIVEKLRAKGLVSKVDEQYVHRREVNSRGGKTIEPQIKEQWFIRVNKPFVLRQDTLGKWKQGEKATLKELMSEAVRSHQIAILPDRFQKTYFQWVDHLRDWCISRQIWFGHRIPVWYRMAEGAREMQVGATSPGEGWEQDPDTLDTWFSSGLWTFSALGWPDQVPWQAHRAFHPTAVLETGYDILFFWVARMILMTSYVLGEVPFRDVYLHGLVRDEQGRKMSKSLGNILDPLTLIPKFGTDAVRLSLLIGSTPGQDLRLSEAKIEGFRNFTNKLWNIARFILLQISQAPAEQVSSTPTLADRWIETRLAQTIASVTSKLETYQLSAAGEELRDFTWGEVADWYLEIVKVQGPSASALRNLLQNLLKLWHPFMPFVTEEIWGKAGFEGMLMIQSWPETAQEGNEAIVTRFETLRSIVTEMRRLRTELRVPLQAKIPFAIVQETGELLTIEEAELSWMMRMTGAQSIAITTHAPAEYATVATSFVWSIAASVTEFVDVEKERAQMQKELAMLDTYISSREQRLQNQEFCAKAPATLVAQTQQQVRDAKQQKEQLLLSLE